MTWGLDKFTTTVSGNAKNLNDLIKEGRVYLQPIPNTLHHLPADTVLRDAGQGYLLPDGRFFSVNHFFVYYGETQ